MSNKNVGKPQVTPHEPEHVNSRRDPEERPVNNEAEAREKSMDKTLADSFPTSDPPSSIPDPGTENALLEPDLELIDGELAGLPEGSWAALSIGDRRVIATGETREEAIEKAHSYGHTEMSLVRAVGHTEEDSKPLGRAS